MEIQLVAHRGFPAQFPENTLVGYQAAVDAGARWVETDIQLSRDRVPMLYHDGTLQRTSGMSSAPWDHDSEQLQQIGAGFVDRFGDQFKDEPIVTLKQFILLAEQYPNVNLLIELKKESLKQFGVESTVAATMDEVQPIMSRCTIISKNEQALERARTHGAKVGWVVPAYDEVHEQIANDLQPEFLICKAQRLPASPATLWSGRWQWMVYPVNDPTDARSHVDRGITLIETDDIGGMQAAFNLT